MFSWAHDTETGGIVIQPARDLRKNSEVAPVWVTELQTFGVGGQIPLPADTGLPIGWICRGNYFSRGQKFARRNGDKIELLQRPKTLEPIDIDGMNSKNAEILTEIEAVTADTLRVTLDDRGIDEVAVAYSGGKDSDALLALMLRTMPERIARAVFADTTQEFSQTYAHVEQKREALRRYGIPLDTAKPYLDALTGWRLFGVPSRNVRWCCQVCKSGALARMQTYAQAIVMGARGIESKYRAGYGLETDRRRQLSAAPTFRPIFDWSAAEVWTYLFFTGTKINPVYRYGHHRACCVCCPFSSPFEVRATEKMAAEELEPYRAEYLRQYPDHAASFSRRYDLDGGTWSRKNAQLLTGEYTELEKIEDNIYKYTIEQNYTIKDSWLKLLKSIYDVRIYKKDTNLYYCQYFTLKHTADNNRLKKLLNRIFYCVGCGYCINYCSNNSIYIESGNIQINIETCTKCGECYSLDCLRASALRGYRRPDGGEKK